MSSRPLRPMRTAHCLRRGISCLFGLLVLAGTVQAQTVYKSIGPDGKVVYTDKPVRGPDGRASTVDAADYANSGARFDATTRWSDPAFSAKRSGDAAADAALESARRAASLAAESATRDAARAYQDRVEASKGKGMILPVVIKPAVKLTTPKTELAQPVAAPAADKRGLADSGLEKFAVEAMATRHLVEQSIRVCSANQPADSGRLAQVLAKWRERNGAILLRQQKLLATSFSGAQIRDMEETASVSNRMKFETANSPVENVRMKWCAQMTADITRGALDPVARPDLVTAGNTSP